MVTELVYGDPHSTPKHPELEAAAIALVTTFQTGIVTLGLGLLRLGFLDVVLSRALLRGFITAVGVVSHTRDVLLELTSRSSSSSNQFPCSASNTPWLILTLAPTRPRHRSPNSCLS
jgi:MFS superfamily sulfate permease-like transporter